MNRYVKVDKRSRTNSIGGGGIFGCIEHAESRFLELKIGVS